MNSAAYKGVVLSSVESGTQTVAARLEALEEFLLQEVAADD